MLPSDNQHSMGASRFNVRHPLCLPIKLGLSTAKVDSLRSFSPGIFSFLPPSPVSISTRVKLSTEKWRRNQEISSSLSSAPGELSHFESL